MKINDMVSRFVEDLTFEALIIWADTLSVEHNENSWLNDEYPDREDELRVAVANAMSNLGAKQ